MNQVVSYTKPYPSSFFLSFPRGRNHDILIFQHWFGSVFDYVQEHWKGLQSISFVRETYFDISVLRKVTFLVESGVVTVIMTYRLLWPPRSHYTIHIQGLSLYSQQVSCINSSLFIQHSHFIYIRLPTIALLSVLPSRLLINSCHSNLSTSIFDLATWLVSSRSMSALVMMCYIK